MIFFRRRPEYDPDKEVTIRLRLRIWTSGWRGVFVLLLLAGAGLTWWKGAEAYRWVKVKRAESLIAQSEAARARGDFKEASNKLGQAATLLQRHPVILRAVARYQIEMHDLSALNTLMDLLKTGEATTDDRIQFASEALRLGRADLVASVMERLAADKSVSHTAAVLALQAQQLAINGHWDDALSLARKAANSPGREDYHAYAPLVFAEMLVHAPPKSAGLTSPEQLNEGIDLLGDLAHRTDKTGLDALATLADLSRGSQAAAALAHKDVEAWVQAAENRSDADPALKVHLWNLRLIAAPGKRAEILQEFIQHIQDKRFSPEQLEAARWLNQLHQHSEALELAQPQRLNSVDWFLVYLDALSGKGDWEQVYRDLTANGQKVPLPNALRRLFEFRSAMETGRHPSPNEEWQDIQAATRTESLPNQFYVAAYAEQLGYPKEAALIYRRLLTADDSRVIKTAKMSRSQRLVCFSSFFRTAAVSLPLEDLSNFLGRFVAEFPEIDEGQNDNAYILLLRGQDMAQACATAKALRLKRPELLAYRSTEALALLKSGEPGAALSLYQGWTTDWSTAPDRCKAVYAAVLRANGCSLEAETTARSINPNLLRPEERLMAGLTDLTKGHTSP